MQTTATRGRTAFTLVECLVVVVIFFILVAVMLPSVVDALPETRVNGLMQQGIQIYKATYGCNLGGYVDGYFPTSDREFASSTQYFVHLVTNRHLQADFAFFTGPGLDGLRHINPAQFKPGDNAWSVVLDVDDQPSDFPLLISRNLLPAATSVPPQSAALTPAMLGETGKGRKLDFNTQGGVVITKAGTGFITKKADFTGLPGSMKRLNPSDVSKPLLRP